MRYKLIIFDFDGTLADTYPWFVSVFNQVADKYKFKKIEEGNAENYRGFSAKKLIDYLGIPPWKVPAILNYGRALMSRDIAKIKVFEGVDSILSKLTEKGAELAIVSSNSYDNIAKVLGTINMSAINFTECGVSLFGKVPKLKKILSRSGIKKSDVIYIGDEARDIEAAKKVNISSGAVAWGYNKIQKLKEMGPTEVFFDVNEIVEKTN